MCFSASSRIHEALRLQQEFLDKSVIDVLGLNAQSKSLGDWRYVRSLPVCAPAYEKRPLKENWEFSGQ